MHANPRCTLNRLRIWLFTFLAVSGCSMPHVVVVGGGPAGMAAAIEASEGLRVTLVEREDALGGMVRYASGISAILEEEGLRAWNEQAGTLNPARDRYARDARSMVIAWTAGLGAHWVPAQTGPQHGVELFVPEGRGQRLVEVLERTLRDRGVEILLGVGVERVEAGRRFEVGLADGRVLSARAVLLATGGYMGNVDMVRERVDLEGAPLLRGSPVTVDGNGFLLALGLGARERLPARVELYAHGIPDARDPERALMIMEGEAAWPIDAGGRPFPWARSSRGDSGRLLLEQGGGKGWLIVDDVGQTKVILRDPVNSRSYRLSNAPARPSARSENLAGIAARLSVPVEALEAGLVEEGRVPDASHPLRRDRPFLAYPLQLTTAKGLTGIESDLEGRALNAAGRPIRGLYVAGELGAFGHPYDGVAMDSTMIPGAILTGRVVGRTLLSDLD
jgi:predicted oxidoreductase